MQVTDSLRDLLQDLFLQESFSLKYFFDNLNLQASEKILQAILECRGLVFLTGVGKSGHVAKKIAVSMTSTGTRALFISPVDSLHGDIGLVTKDDLFILISKSGESDELLNLIPFIRNKGAACISIVSEQNSRLSKAADISITLPVDKELCPFDLAPTTSTSIQMIFGDVITIALMRLKNFTIDQFATNHPGGKIGKKITLKVKDLMRAGDMIPRCFPENTLKDILAEQSNKQAGCIFVTDHKDVLLGIFTDGDLRRSLLNHGADALDLSMQELMTKNPRSTHPDTFAWDAMKYMEADQKRPITVLAVADHDKKLVGFIKLHDILQSNV